MEWGRGGLQKHELVRKSLKFGPEIVIFKGISYAWLRRHAIPGRNLPPFWLRAVAADVNKTFHKECQLWIPWPSCGRMHRDEAWNERLCTETTLMFQGVQTCHHVVLLVAGFDIFHRLLVSRQSLLIREIVR